MFRTFGVQELLQVVHEDDKQDRRQRAALCNPLIDTYTLASGKRFAFADVESQTDLLCYSVMDGNMCRTYSPRAQVQQNRGAVVYWPRQLAPICDL